MKLPNGRPIDILGIGTSTVDRLYRVPHFPSGDSVQVPLDFCEMGGGPTSTALCVASALGSKTRLIDRIGANPNPKAILAEYESYGVSSASIQIAKTGTTGHASVLVHSDNGQRAITYQPGTVAELEAGEIDLGLLNKSRILHMNGRHRGAALEAISAAEEAGTPVSFDGGAGRFREESIELFSKADILIVSRDFGEKATGKTSPTEILLGLQTISQATVLGVTDGEAGSWIWDSETDAPFHQPAIPPKQLIDTTGCGDSYHGAFLHALCQGQNLRACAKLAAEIASRNCEGLGGRYAARQQAESLA